MQEDWWYEYLVLFVVGISTLEVYVKFIDGPAAEYGTSKKSLMCLLT